MANFEPSIITKDFGTGSSSFFRMSRLILQTRTFVPILRRSFLERLSSDLAGKSLVRLSSTSTCIACGKTRTHRYKEKSAVMKTGMSWSSTRGYSDLVGKF